MTNERVKLEVSDIITNKCLFDMHKCPDCGKKLKESVVVELHNHRQSVLTTAVVWEILACPSDYCVFKYKKIARVK